MFFVTAPQRFDVIVTDNLFGDIITDLGAAIAGGIGLAASGNLDVEPARTRACSSRCTARRPTSPARARPTRPPPSCPSRCCSTTSACRPRPPRSTPPSPPTSRRASARLPAYDVQHRRRTRQRGDRLTTLDAMTGTDLIALKPTGTPLRRRRARVTARRPRLRPVLHRPHGHHRLGRRAGLARRPARAVRPDLDRPRGHGAPLRAGDLRGPQGLPAARRLDLDLPARAERAPLPALGAAGWRMPELPEELFLASIEALVQQDHAGCRPAPRGASTCGRSCSRPRSASACGRPTPTCSC